MQQNNGLKPENKISIQSKNSLRSLSKSLGRPSWQIRQPSLGKKPSLVYAMSIESQRKSDIFQSLLESQKKPKFRLSNLVEGVHSDQANQYNIMSYIQRNSDIIVGEQCQFQINHQCKCWNECLQMQCPCSLSKQQICIKGSCCIICIKYKNNLLSINNHNQNNLIHNTNNSIHNHNHNTNLIHNNYNNLNHLQKNLINEQIKIQYVSCNCKNTQCLKSYCKCFQKGDFCTQKCGCQTCKNKSHSLQRQQALNAIKINHLPVYCTCKKTKCNKKYCSCFNSGIKCSKMCSCQNCQNCDHNQEMLIQIYNGDENDNYQSLQIPQRMSFQSINFQ